MKKVVQNGKPEPSGAWVTRRRARAGREAKFVRSLLAKKRNPLKSGFLPKT